MNLFIEVFLQTLLSFFSILFITRILGRQQVAQLTLYEYINGITFGSIAAAVATDIGQHTWLHLMGLFLFGILTFLMSYISLKSRNASKVIQGEPILVIQDGRILEKNLTRYHYTVDDLTHLMRMKDVFSITDVKYGILETTGELSLMKVARKDNLKSKDMESSEMNQQDLETDIIVTGKIIYENLMNKHLSVKWLTSQLKEMGIKNINDVYYAAIDKNNKLYIDKYEDDIDEPIDLTPSNNS
jgi:uncharacterized membrane protein YcaP (DUF421 family)